MKYTLDLLPINAFQGRGTPVGGRGLRLCGGSDMGGYVNPHEVEAAQEAAYQQAQAPAPAPAEAAPAPAADSGGGGGGGGGGDPAPAPAPAPVAPAAVVSDPVRAPLAPVNQWEQTVNDIYQQTFGRQADPSGMASFTAALNAGMTGEQMRETLRTSAEGQSMGLSPAPAAPVPPLTAAKTAQWEYQPGGAYSDETTGLTGYAAPYYLDVNSGERKDIAPVEYSGINIVDPNTLAQHLAPNYEGTPTQFYDAQGNLKGVLIDMVGKGGDGQYIVDPASLGLILKTGEKPSIDSEIQQRNESGQLLFVDPITGGTTIYNTGVPASTGQTVKNQMYINDPGPRGGIIPADVYQGMLLLAATMATGGVGGALMNAAGVGAGAGLTATEAAALMGGTLSEAGAAATMGTQGLNWGAIASSAAKQGALSAGVTALKGGSPSDILKAGLLATVTSGAGGAIGGAGLGDLGTALAKGALQVGATAATGGNVQNALISSVIGAVLPTAMDQIIPKDTFEGLPSAIKSTLEKAVASSITAAATGGNLTDAALNSIMSSATNAVTDYVSEATGFKGLTLSESLDKIGNYFSNFFTPVDTGSGDSSVEEDDGSGGDTGALPVTGTTGNTGQGALPVSGGTTQTTNGGALPNTTDTTDETGALPNTTDTTGADDEYIYYTDAQGNQVYGPRSMANATPDAAQTVSKDVVDQAVEVQRQSLLKTFGQAGVSFLDNTIGSVAPYIVQMAGQIGLRTADQTAQLLSSFYGGDYLANPDKMEEYAKNAANLFAQPFGRMLGVTETEGYKSETLGQVLSYVSEHAEDLAKNVSNATGGFIPKGDVLFMLNLIAPEVVKSAIGSGAILAKDVSFAMENPSAFGSKLAEGLYSTGNPNPVLDFLRGKAETPSGMAFFNEPSQKAFGFLDKTENSTAGAALVKDLLADPESAFVKKTPNQALLDDLLYSSKKADSSIIDQMLADLKKGEDIPADIKARVKTSVDDIYTGLSKEAPSTSVSNFLQDLRVGGVSLKEVGFAVDLANVIAGGSGGDGGDVSTNQVLQDVNDATKELPAEERLPAAFEFLINAAKLNSTAFEALENDWVTDFGVLTDAGIKRVAEVQPAVQEQPAAETQPVTNLQPSPVTNPALNTETQPVLQEPVNTVKVTEPPLGGGNISGGGTSSVNPPVVNPPLSNVNPPTNNVNPPTNDVNPPIVDPTKPVTPPLTPTASTPAAPAASGSGGYYGGYSLLAPTIGALPGNLESTSLKGADVKDYNPFENYNVYQQLAPINAASGGGTGALQQMQQGIAGVDPRLYSMLQARATPNYFSYGSDQNSGLSTVFAGNQIMAKPTPSIPLISSSGDSSTRALYKMSGAEGSGGAGTPATLGATSMKDGGTPHIPEFITGATGHYVKGRGDGQSDSIPAMLASGEYVFDAETVAQLGNGSSDAGAKVLDKMREAIRHHKRSAPIDSIPPKSKSPLEYMKGIRK